MASKRDFGRAFDIPVGFQSDILAAEPQALESSTAHTTPGQWPEEYLDSDEATAPARSDTFFTTAARFATSVTLEVFKLPSRLVNSFTRQQQIRAVPIIREDGASKRRLVDAGLTPTTPTRRCGSGGSQGTLRQPLSSSDVTRNHLSGLWLETLSTSTFDSQCSEFPQGDDINDSLDWSMDDVDSGTPPHIPQTGSPTTHSWLRRPERRTSSPISQFSALRKFSVTPMRQQLLRKQLRAPVSSLVLQQPNRIMAPPISHAFTIDDLKKMNTGSSLIPINAPAVATNAQEVSAHYRAELETRENRDADARAAAEPSYCNPVDTIDIDLSFLQDASHADTIVTPHKLSPSPVRRKSVRWASQSTVKSYYVDEKISEMLDSTLESIRSPTPKPDFAEDDDEEAEDDDEEAEDDEGDAGDDDEEAENLQEVEFEWPDSDSDFDDDVDGPSLDDSLHESQLSKELLQDLEEDFKNLLAKAPPPPPPPKPLVAPLSIAERTQLEDIAAKSKHGLNEAFPIIPHKISARDFGTLLPDQFNGSAKAWLNDEIVNEYLAVLVKECNQDAAFVFKRGGPAPPYHAFSSHWYNSIKGGVKNVERWAGRVGLGGKQFLDAKLVLYPICDGSHWRLLAVKPQERIIEYLDSLGWDGEKYVDKLRLYLKNELKELYKDEEWTVVEQQRSSRQLNGSDCGVFVLLNALVLLLGYDTKKVIACNGMLEARERMAITIITGHPVELDY
ncbi:uncharacterized protein EKO05_0009048 [Ascochyta rabiei]|uniref:Cysteine-type peptidase n=1 Tax=Didymella rabiei TaxID=5454 RepID=A0A162X8S9_DIDRA|nr:uncharacterized protein EKO05_0009048 [Ascochyta rabiei]KZM19408.1 cysteine-type peptidase [Ascochyta rabiei]UPX18757.1 hypothetical protein EKO05_0009048 [Ascochyta rabiei]